MESSQNGDENDATLQLASLMVSRSRYYGDRTWLPDEDAHTYRAYTPDLFKEVFALIKAGARVDLVVCAYLIDKRLYHSILEANNGRTVRPAERYHGTAFPSDVREGDKRPFISHVITPWIDAAEQRDSDAISIYSSMGLRLGSITATLTAHNIAYYHVRNPFLPALTHRRVDVVRQLLGLIPVGKWPFKPWLDEALLTVLWPSFGDSSHLEMVKLLQNSGANLSIRDFSLSVRLVDHLARCTKSSSNKASSTEQIPRAPFLNEVNLLRLVTTARSSEWSRGPRGKTALMIATGCATTAMCRLLFHDGADPDETDTYNMTALCDAIHWGHLEAVRFLLEHKADPNHIVDERRLQPTTPGKDNHEMFAPWIQSRDEAAAKYKAAQFSLSHIAAHLGRTKALELLCIHGADITRTDKQGRTPLDIAIRNQQYTTASYLRKRMSSKPLEAASLGYETRDMSRQSTTQLCVGCAAALEMGIFGALPDPSSRHQSCSFCHLLSDCRHAKGNGLMALTYGDGSNSATQALEMRSARGLIFRHPVLKVPDDLHALLQRLSHANIHGDDTSSPNTTEQVVYWLSRCLEGHSQCRHNHASKHLPTRILEIGDIEGEQTLRLRQHVNLHVPYVALSHRWGVRGLPVTTLENIADRLKGIPAAELSETMRNAITVVRSLGYRYLWIDALCIIQDSTDDWLSEASKMSSVFNGAVLTLAVADAEDHTKGIFRKRVARCTRPFHIPYMRGIPHRDRVNVDGEAHYYIFPRSDLVGTGTRPKGTLDTRGWILQEQLLSTRILYYDRGQVYWDCVTLSASESSPITASLLEEKDPDESWALKLVRRTLAGSLTGETMRGRISDAWLEIIKNYSARELTKQEDRMIALNGIIQPLRDILGEEPIAGMWRQHLWRQLTWWIQDSTATQSNIGQGPAPSWSWLAVSKRVYYHNSLLGESPAEHAVEHKFTELHPYSFMIDHVESKELSGILGVTGTLTVTVKCFPYRLTAMDLKKPVYKRWNQARLKLNTGRWMLDHTIQLPVDLQCLIVAEDAVAKMAVCLCIVPDEEQHGKWKRIGLCHWDGLAWQIPSFTGTTPETGTFTII